MVVSCVLLPLLVVVRGVGVVVVVAVGGVAVDGVVVLSFFGGC